MTTQEFVPVYGVPNKDNTERLIANMPLLIKARQRLQALLLAQEKPYSPYTYCVTGRGIAAAIGKIATLAAGRRPILIVDIANCFDSVPHEQLLEVLTKAGFNNDQLNTLKAELTIPYRHKGVLQEKKQGLYQGSPLSNVLLDIYLYEFDHALAATIGLVRYVDDMALGLNSMEEYPAVMSMVTEKLKALGLQIKTTKTRLYATDESFEHLGFRFVPIAGGCLVRPSDSRTVRLNHWLVESTRTLARGRYVDVRTLHRMITEWYGTCNGLQGVTDWSEIASNTLQFYGAIKRAAHAHPNACATKQLILKRLNQCKRMTQSSPAATMAA